VKHCYPVMMISNKHGEPYPETPDLVLCDYSPLGRKFCATERTVNLNESWSDLTRDDIREWAKTPFFYSLVMRDKGKDLHFPTLVHAVQRIGLQFIPTRWRGMFIMLWESYHGYMCRFEFASKNDIAHCTGSGRIEMAPVYLGGQYILGVPADSSSNLLVEIAFGALTYCIYSKPHKDVDIPMGTSSQLREDKACVPGSFYVPHCVKDFCIKTPIRQEPNSSILSPMTKEELVTDTPMHYLMSIARASKGTQKCKIFVFSTHQCDLFDEDTELISRDDPQLRIKLTTAPRNAIFVGVSISVLFVGTDCVFFSYEGSPLPGFKYNSFISTNAKMPYEEIDSYGDQELDTYPPSLEFSCFFPQLSFLMRSGFSLTRVNSPTGEVPFLCTSVHEYFYWKQRNFDLLFVLPLRTVNPLIFPFEGFAGALTVLETHTIYVTGHTIRDPMVINGLIPNTAAWTAKAGYKCAVYNTFMAAKTSCFASVTNVVSEKQKFIHPVHFAENMLVESDFTLGPLLRTETEKDYYIFVGFKHGSIYCIAHDVEDLFHHVLNSFALWEVPPPPKFFYDLCLVFAHAPIAMFVRLFVQGILSWDPKQWNVFRRKFCTDLKLFSPGIWTPSNPVKGVAVPSLASNLYVESRIEKKPSSQLGRLSWEHSDFRQKVWQEAMQGEDRYNDLSWQNSPSSASDNRIPNDDKVEPDSDVDIDMQDFVIKYNEDEGFPDDEYDLEDDPRLQDRGQDDYIDPNSSEFNDYVDSRYTLRPAYGDDYTQEKKKKEPKID